VALSESNSVIGGARKSATSGECSTGQACRQQHHALAQWIQDCFCCTSVTMVFFALPLLLTGYSNEGQQKAEPRQDQFRCFSFARMARSMLTMSRELIVTRKTEVITDDVNENLEDLRSLLPDDFKDLKKDEQTLPVAIKRWKKTVRKISLAKKFLFNLQESDRIRRYVTVLSHGVASLICLPFFIVQQRFAK